jgi:ABC-2 type transport system permease protein
MAKILSTIFKELLLLWRDKTGLLVLFLMPVFLVVVMSLVQANILQMVGESNTQVLVLDQDNSTLGRKVDKALGSSANLQVTLEARRGERAREDLLEAVNQGRYQVGLVIPPGFTRSVRDRIRKDVVHVFGGREKGSGSPPRSVHLQVHFDPAVRGAFRKAVLNSLNTMVLRLKAMRKMELLVELIPKKIAAAVRSELGPGALQKLSPALMKMKSDVRGTQLFRLDTSEISSDPYRQTPNSVQQNVPAWTVFSIFFIVVPMAGGFIKEKNDGTLRRLLSMPVSPLVLIGGKILAYALICALQIGVICLVGMTVLPLLGTSQLQLGNAYGTLACLSVVVVLAATSYGILLGTLLNTYEQASTVGPLSIVIAAAIGGIMVPVYAMPDTMQAVSLISPLGWGLSAYLKVIVREGTFYSIVPQMAGLLAFAVFNFVLSWVVFFSSLRTK